MPEMKVVPVRILEQLRQRAVACNLDLVVNDPGQPFWFTLDGQKISKEFTNGWNATAFMDAFELASSAGLRALRMQAEQFKEISNDLLRTRPRLVVIQNTGTLWFVKHNDAVLQHPDLPAHTFTKAIEVAVKAYGCEASTENGSGLTFKVVDRAGKLLTKSELAALK